MQRARRSGDAGIVDQNVEALEVEFDALGQCFDRGKIGDVALDD